MEKIRFSTSETIYNGEVVINGDIATIKFDGKQPSPSVLVSGFVLLNEHNLLPQRDCSDFKTLYRTLSDSIQLSDDGSIYVPPTKDVVVTVSWNDNEDEDGIRPSSIKVTLYKDEEKKSTVTVKDSADWTYTFENMPVDSEYTVKAASVDGYEAVCSGCSVSETHTPIATVKVNKINELNEIQQSIIKAGTDVKLTDGTIEHFTLSDHDQTSILGLALQVQMGLDQIPWHTADQSQPCKYYSNADMSKIIEGATAAITLHVTLFRDFRIYVNALTDAEVIKNIEYGIENLPVEYWSQVLKDIVDKINKAMA